MLFVVCCLLVVVRLLFYLLLSGFDCGVPLLVCGLWLFVVEGYLCDVGCLLLVVW